MSNIDFSALPEAFKKRHDFLVKATNNGESWSSYQSSDTVKKTIDIYLAKLNEFVNATKKGEKNQRQKQVRQRANKEFIHEAIIKQTLINPDGSPKRKTKRIRFADESHRMAHVRWPVDSSYRVVSFFLLHFLQ